MSVYGLLTDIYGTPMEDQALEDVLNEDDNDKLELTIRLLMELVDSGHLKAWNIKPRD